MNLRWQILKYLYPIDEVYRKSDRSGTGSTGIVIELK